MAHCEYIIPHKVLLQNSAVSAIKSSWAVSLVSWLKITDISGTDMVLKT
jgi:hypothetical protein